MKELEKEATTIPLQKVEQMHCVLWKENEK